MAGLKIWNGIDDLPTPSGPLVASIGNYDGVHRGHQAILGAVARDARARGLEAVLITFDPHPLSVVAPDRNPGLLQTRRQKLESLHGSGLSAVWIVEFTPELAQRDGNAFFDEVLAPRVSFASVHVGENFRFGHRRSGDLALLREIGARRGFDVIGVPPVKCGAEVVSSTAIRTAVAEGEVERARRFLGRPFALTGKVERGDGRGREIGFPTANLDTDNDLLPAAGVYVTEVIALAGRHPAVTNVGVRPTIDDGGALTVESHLLEFSEDLYDQRIEVRFLARIRGEQEFADLASLADQIARDRAAAASWFDNVAIEST